MVDNIEQKILSEIPLISAMDMSLLRRNSVEAVWSLPLAPNVNHLGTVFGGSLYSASAIACYSFLLHHLAERNIVGADLVISEGSIRYMRPAVSPRCLVHAMIAEDDNWVSFWKIWQVKNKARIKLIAKIFNSDGTEASVFSGTYVVKAKSPSL